jgi:4-hydroxy-3-polyprenylbenzoate decarboxylase
MIAPPQSVFLGITGASGAPYALGLVRELARRGCRLQMCISNAGIGVVAHELGFTTDDRTAVTAAFLAAAGAEAETYAPDDFAAPPSSGSAFPDAAVICPCSLSSAAEIALGTSRTLIHRAGAVAIKERRPFVVVPRETPLSAIHLRRLLELAEAGAVIVPPMPGFYNLPQTLQDAVDFVVGKVLCTLGFVQDLYPAWPGRS